MLGCFLCALLLVLHLTAVFYISSEFVHECEGNHCHTCECIQMCEAFLHNTAGAACVVIAAVFAISGVFFITVVKEFILRHTLVSAKVRLNN